MQLFLLPLLLGHQLLFVLGELVAHSSSLLASQVQRPVLLFLVEFLDHFFLSLINDGQDTGDGSEGACNLENLNVTLPVTLAMQSWNSSPSDCPVVSSAHPSCHPYWS